MADGRAPSPALRSFLNLSSRPPILDVIGPSAGLMPARHDRRGGRKGPVKVASMRAFNMSRDPSLSSPFLPGFDEIERALDRVAKGADGYPPYNIERIARENGKPERLRITVAVAGFTRDQLDVSMEESQLVIRGRQQD